MPPVTMSKSVPRLRWLPSGRTSSSIPCGRCDLKLCRLRPGASSASRSGMPQSFRSLMPGSWSSLDQRFSARPVLEGEGPGGSVSYHPAPNRCFTVLGPTSQPGSKRIASPATMKGQSQIHQCPTLRSTSTRPPAKGGCACQMATSARGKPSPRTVGAPDTSSPAATRTCDPRWKSCS